ncbi:MAG: class III signal peptide-containing protein, partial [Candidatus ainarchaeum sp.]|nr:class III signal peptide-containing protein [Candidatus ainarchaeum sp.]
MIKNKKGQGALEYLLLIGGAVLIAVIVIALLVGMGGQSRDSAKDQADKASKATDIPQPASITSITPVANSCTPNSDGNIILDWAPLATGGTYNLRAYDYTGEKDLNVTIGSNTDGKLDASVLHQENIMISGDDFAACEN